MCAYAHDQVSGQHYLCQLIDFILVSIRHEIRMGWGRSLDSREIKFIPFDDLGAVYCY